MALPEFDNPPVVEVALSVQFEPIEALRTVQLGLLWQRFREQYPKTEEQPPLDPIMERFGVSGRAQVRFQMLEKPPVPRVWFLNGDETELIQVQPDRFAHNWRKVGEGDAYPRYPAIRAAFERDLDIFCRFIEHERLGSFSPNLCEVTYVNHIVAGTGWQRFGEVGRVLTFFDPHFSDDRLGEPEEARIRLQYVLSDSAQSPIGRLHISCSPVLRRKDNQPMLVLNLTARGKPDGEGAEGVLKFLDRGRDEVVRSFASVTTPDMHAVWRRRDA